MKLRRGLFSIMTGFGLALFIVGLPVGSAVSAVEINIGVNNSVNTGTVTGGGGCLQGDGVTKRHQRPVDSFHHVVVDGVFEVNIVCGDKPQVQVTADQNLHSLIATTINDDRLKISTTGSFCTSNSLIIDVTLDRLASIVADGSNEISVDCRRVQLDSFDIDLRGTSEMKVLGAGETVNIRLQDSVALDGSAFTAEKVSIIATETAEALLRVTGRLSGESRDASEVHYYGRPSKVETQEFDVGEFIAED